MIYIDLYFVEKMVLDLGQAPTIIGVQPPNHEQTSQILRFAQQACFNQEVTEPLCCDCIFPAPLGPDGWC